MQACGNCYNGEGVEGTRLSLPANVRIRIDTLKFPPLPKTQREHHGNNNLFKYSLLIVKETLMSV